MGYIKPISSSPHLADWNQSLRDQRRLRDFNNSLSFSEVFVLFFE